MDSKLARKMAYKKKLEEEYREFQERCKVKMMIKKPIIVTHKSHVQYEKKTPGSGYEMRLLDEGQWSYQEISMRRRKDFE